MSSNSTWLPQLEALLAIAPAGTNPFAWYLERLAESVGGPQVQWAKPIFIVIAAVSFINIIGATVALVLKYRQDGCLPLYKMRDHRSGGRYICLNTTTVFLYGHIITSLVFGLYVLLHTYYYSASGRSYQDLSWAAMMWLAPYVAIFLTSTGVLYGVLVAPTTLSDIRRTGEDTLLPPKSPLAGLPCWLLNSFIFLGPTVVIVSILVPAIKLVNAVKQSELLGIQATTSMTKYALLYDQDLAPTLSEQADFLQVVMGLQSSVDTARRLWSPTFGLWSGWVALAGVLSFIAFIAVSRVTKARLVFAQRQFASGHDITAQCDSSDIFHEKPSRPTTNSIRSPIVSQARSDHITLSLQFGLAAVLLFVCEVMLLWDTIVGYDVHLKPDLLATAVIVPPIAYYLHASMTLALIMTRTIRTKATGPRGGDSRLSSPLRPGMLPRFVGAHSRQDSEDSLLARKRSQNAGGTRTRGAGRVLVSELDGAYGIAPSVVHHVEVTQTVEIQTDGASIQEKESLASAREGSQDDLHDHLEKHGRHSPDSRFGHAM